MGSSALWASTTVYYLPQNFPEVCGQNLTTGEPVCEEGATESVTAFCEAELAGLDLARGALGVSTCSDEDGTDSIPGVNYVFLVDDRPLTPQLSNLLGDAIRDLGDGPLVFPSRTNESVSNQGIVVGERLYREGRSGRRESDTEWRTRVAALSTAAEASAASGPVRVFLVDPRLPRPSGAAEGVWGHIPISGRAERLHELCERDCPTLIRTFEQLTNGSVGAEVGRLMGRIGGLSHIEYYLVNDFTQDLEQATIDHYELCESEHEDTGRPGVWPCAWRDTGTNPPSGIAVLGELHGEELSEGGRNNAEWDSTLIHETIHTLDRTDWDTRHYGAAYGPDGDHYFNEVLPDPHAVFMEGFANFAGMHFAPSVAQRAISDLGGNGWLYSAEAGTLAADAAGPANSGTSQVTYTDQNGASQTSTYYYYRWRSLDAESLLRNEMVAAVALYYIADSVDNGYDQLLRSFRTTNWRSRTLLTLIGDFVAESDWEWRLGTRDDAASLFAIALIDILTHFDFSDGELRSSFIRESALQESILDDYIGSMRPRLQREVAGLGLAQAIEQAKQGILGR